MYVYTSEGKQKETKRTKAQRVRETQQETAVGEKSATRFCALTSLIKLSKCAYGAVDRFINIYFFVCMCVCVSAQLTENHAHKQRLSS